MNSHIPSNTRRLLYALATLAAILLTTPLPAAALEIKLADIVGGGDGSGTGTPGSGIDPSNGGTTFPGMFQISQTNDTDSYHSSIVNFVDGVFIPDGGAGSVTLDSAGHSFGAFPNTDSLSWDLIRDGANQNSGTVLDGVNYASGVHTLLGLHANKGITFDLQAIAAANPGFVSDRFTGVAGLSHIAGGYGTADWWVFVDGVLAQSQANSPGGVGFGIDVPLTSASQFLTLVSTNAGDDFLVDQIIFGDPVLHLTAVPEPGSFVLAACGCAILGVVRRRRR